MLFAMQGVELQGIIELQNCFSNYLQDWITRCQTGSRRTSQIG